MNRGEYTREPDINFRTAVLVGGLLATATYWGSLAEDVKLVSLLDRRGFR